MKRAKRQPVTTDNLRQFWLAQIEVFDEMTGLLEAQRELVMMQSWRGELVRLLTEFPGTQHA